MKKKAASREKAAPVQENDLVWAKGSSGYVIAYDEVPPADQPPGGSGG